jgi:hypothetical protein
VQGAYLPLDPRPRARGTRLRWRGCGPRTSAYAAANRTIPASVPKSFPVTTRGPLFRGPSTSPQVGPPTVNVGPWQKTVFPQADMRVSG